MYYTKKLDHAQTTHGGSSSLGDQAQVVRLGDCGLVFLTMHLTTTWLHLNLITDNYSCDPCKSPF